MFFYSDNTLRGGTPIPTANMNATRIFLDHYSNYMFLDFILKNSQDRSEKHQATKELAICERKMAFWKKHPNYIHSAVVEGVAKLKKDWKQK